MIIKVCGLRNRVNINEISQLDIQMIGLNFYPPSSRYIPRYDELAIQQIAQDISKVGVFVKEGLKTLQDITQQYGLDYVQLHGDESVDYCRAASQFAKVIKVFRVDDEFSFSDIKPYETSVDYFLFDTKTTDYGGSGRQFSWDMLQQYQGTKPFLLSGGIGPDDAAAIKSIDHPSFAGIDINSRFELAPAIKSYDMIATFINQLNQTNHEISS